MKNDIVFLTAPIQIHRVLNCIEKCDEEKITVVCPSELAPFFRVNTKCEVIVPWVHPNLITRSNWWKLPLNLVRLWRNYGHYFWGLKFKTVHVFFTSWALSYMFFIKRLHNNYNVVAFYTPADNYPEPPSRFPLQKDLVGAVLYWFARLLGCPTIVYDKSVPSYEMKREYYGDEFFKIDDDKTSIYNKLKYNNIDAVKGMDTIFLSENVTTEGADLRSVHFTTNRLYYMLEKYFPDHYCVKGHPREHDIYGDMNHAKNILSPYLIAETLFGHPFKFVISYYSEALVSAKLFCPESTKVVSLIHLIDWGNQELKKYWLRRYKEYGVIMPKSFSELEKILNDKE
jgi:hypothetical protein